MHNIIGIDPSICKCGWAVIKSTEKDKLQRISSGVIITSPEAKMHHRLGHIFEGLRDIINTSKPVIIGIEQTLVRHKSEKTSLILAQARSVPLILGSIMPSIQIVKEFAPTSVKKAVTGNGRADKESVKKMVRILLNISEDKKMSHDESDALAIAICASRHLTK